MTDPRTRSLSDLLSIAKQEQLERSKQRISPNLVIQERAIEAADSYLRDTFSTPDNPTRKWERMDIAAQRYNEAGGGYLPEIQDATLPNVHPAGKEVNDLGRKGGQSIHDGWDSSKLGEIFGKGKGDSTLAKVVNPIAAFVDGTSQMTQNVLGSVDGLKMALAGASLTPEDTELHLKVATGQATPEEVQKYEAKSNQGLWHLSTGSFNPSVKERVEAYTKAMDALSARQAKVDSLAISSSAHEAKLQEGIKEALDSGENPLVIAKGVLEAFGDNPQGAIGLISRNLPQVIPYLINPALGAVVSAGDATGYSGMQAAEGVAARTARGESLTGADTASISRDQAAHALSNFLGDVIAGGVASSGSKALKSFVNGGNLPTAAKVVGGLGASALGEGVTGATQEILEQDMKGEERDMAAVGTSAILEAFAGAGTPVVTTGANAASNIAINTAIGIKNIPKALAEATATSSTEGQEDSTAPVIPTEPLTDEEVQTPTQEDEEASVGFSELPENTPTPEEITSGDISAYTDIRSASHNPTKAANILVYSAAAKGEPLVDQIPAIEKLAEDATALRDSFDRVLTQFTPEAIQQTFDLLVSQREALAADPDNAEIKNMVAALERKHTYLTNPDNEANTLKSRDNLNKHLEELALFKRDILEADANSAPKDTMEVSPSDIDSPQITAPMQAPSLEEATSKAAEALSNVNHTSPELSGLAKRMDSGIKNADTPAVMKVVNDAVTSASHAEATMSTYDNLAAKAQSTGKDIQASVSAIGNLTADPTGPITIPADPAVVAPIREQAGQVYEASKALETQGKAFVRSAADKAPTAPVNAPEGDGATPTAPVNETEGDNNASPASANTFTPKKLTSKYLPTGSEGVKKVPSVPVDPVASATAESAALAQHTYDTLSNAADNIDLTDSAKSITGLIQRAFDNGLPNIAKEIADKFTAPVDADNLNAEDIATISKNQQEVGEFFDSANQAYQENPITQGMDEATQGMERGNHEKGYSSSTIEAFKNPVVPGNAVRENLTQRTRANMPLTAVDNFVTTLRSGAIKLSDFLPEGFLKGKEPETVRKISAALRDSVQFVQAVENALYGSFVESVTPNADYRYRDPIQYLLKDVVDENGNTVKHLDENVITAIGASLYLFIIENSQNGYKTTGMVNRMLGRQEDAPIDWDTYNIMASMDTSTTIMANTIGEKAINILGIRELKGKGYEYLLPKLTASIGNTAFRAAMEMGLITQEVVDTSHLGIGEKATFIKFKKDAEGQLTGAVADIKELNKGTHSAVSRMYTGKPPSKLPTSKPTPVSTTIDGLGRKVPSKMHADVNKDARRPYKVKKILHKIFATLNPDILETILGVDRRPDSSIHVDRRKAVAAKNDQLRNQLSEGMEYIEEVGLDAPIYISKTVWSQQRVGQESSVLNPLLHKQVGRILLGAEGLEQTYSLNSQEHLNTFFHSIGEAFGLKGENYKPEKIREKIEATLQTSTFQEAIEGLITLLDDSSDAEMTHQQQLALMDAVEAMGEDALSLDALASVAAMEKAIRDEEDHFVANNLGSVDGKSSGQILSNLLLGAYSSEAAASVLDAGGFFTDENTADFADFMSNPKNAGYYERVVGAGLNYIVDMQQARLQALNDLKNGNSEARKKAKEHLNRNKATHKGASILWEFLGQPTDENGKVTGKGRNLVKTATLSISFGAGSKTAANSLVSLTHENILKTFEKFASEQDDSSIEVAVRDLNALVKHHHRGKGAAPTLGDPTKLNHTNILDVAFTKKFVNGLEQAVQNEIGDPLAAYLEMVNEGFNRRTKALAEASNAMYAIYDAIETERREAFEDHFLGTQEGWEMRTRVGTKFGLPFEMRKELDAESEAYKPYINSAYSAESNEPTSGLLAAKQGRSVDKNLTVETKHSKGTTTTSPYIPAPRAPGAAIIGTSTHSLDGKVITKAVAEFGGTSGHDAWMGGGKKLQTVGKSLNQSVFLEIAKYNPLLETARGLLRQLNYLTEMGVDNNTLAKIHGNIIAEQTKARPWDVDNIPSIKEIASDLAANARIAENNKLEFLSNVKHVAQYAMGGTSHRVTEADLKVIKELQNSFPERMAILDELVNHPLIAEIAASTPLTKEVSNVVAAPSTEAVVEDVNPTPIKESNDAYMRTPGASYVADAIRAIKEVLGDSITVQVANALKKLNPNSQDSLHKQLSDAKVLKNTYNTIANALGTYISNNPVANTSQLGEPLIAPNKPLEAFLAAGGSIPVRGVISHLLQATKGSADNVPYYRLLQMASQIVNPNMVVEYVTPVSRGAGIISQGALSDTSNAMGWFSSDNNRQVIYVRSSDFVHSAITPELLTHEIIHAALGGIIEAALNNPKHPAYNEVKNLSDLLEQAKAVASPADLQLHKNALSNVHELVSWGLTNSKFMEFLQGIEATKTKPNEATRTLSQKFRDILVSIFKKAFSKRPWGAKDNQALYTAFDSLIDNSADLFGLAREARKSMNDSLLWPKDKPLTLFAKADNNPTIGQTADSLDTGNNSTEHVNDLKALIGDLDHKATGVFQQAKDAPVNGSTAPTALGKAATVAIPMSDLEQFTKELLFTTLSEGITRSQTLRSSRDFTATNKYMAHAMKNAPTSFKGTAAFNELFGLDAKGRSLSPVERIANFMALSLTSETIKNELSKVPPMPGTVATSPMRQKALDSVAQALDWVYDEHTKGMETNPSEALKEFSSKIAMSLATRKESQLGKALSVTDSLEDSWDNVLTKSKESISNAISKLNPSSRGGVTVKNAVTVIDALLQGETHVLTKSMQDFRNTLYNKKNGLLASTGKYIAGYDQKLTALMQATKQIERRKEMRSDAVAGLVLKGFDQGGAYLTPKDKAAITASFLRTDAQSLLGHYSEADIARLTYDKAFARAEIAKLEAQLAATYSSPLEANRYVRYAEALGSFMATGYTNAPNLPLNAHGVASGWMLGQNHSYTDAQITTIDMLATLHAMVSTPDNGIKAIIEREANKADGDSGISILLGIHSHVERSANFDAAEKGARIKGYTPTITNPETDLVFVDSAEVENYELAGYSRVGDTYVDASTAPNEKPTVMMVRKFGRTHDRVSGILPLIDNQSKGTITDSVVRESPNSRVSKALVAASATTASNMAKQFADGVLNPSKGTRYSVPLFGEDGKVEHYRYMMDHNTADTVLEKNADFSLLLGRMAGASVDKQLSRQHAQDLVAELKQDWEANKDKEKHNFIKLSAKSTVPEFKEMYLKLPSEIKENNKVLHIRKDLADLILGYKKFAISDSFFKDPQERNALERHIVGSLEIIFKAYAKQLKNLSDAQAEHYAKRLAPAILKGGKAVRELAMEMKDWIVIKSGFVFAANLLSNATLLKIQGVPFKDLFKKQAEALRAIRELKDIETQISNLEIELDSALLRSSGVHTAATSDMSNRLQLLRDRLENNPAKFLYDQGMVSTIAEDIEQNVDPFSYKNSLSQKIQNKLDTLPDFVGKVAKNLYMTKDTPVYKFMFEATQYSDFVARYTLYEHLTKREKNPLPVDQALEEINEAFVVYDIPLPKAIQYADDMFILPFSKYFLSIQRVLFKQLRDRPVSTLSTILLADAIGLSETVQDTNILGRIGNNPFWASVAESPEVFGKILPINLLMQTMK